MDRGHAGGYSNVLNIDLRVAVFHKKPDDTVQRDVTATTRGDGYLKVWSVEYDGLAIPVSQCPRHRQRSAAQPYLASCRLLHQISALRYRATGHATCSLRPVTDQERTVLLAY